jgi:SAM-dependent methyltransferase
MSFSPLPTTLLEELAGRRGEPVVELGCGDGRLSALLEARGCAVWRLDRRPPWHGSAAQVVADAGALPLGEGSVGLLICANLLRHLWPPPGGRVVPDDWRRCLRAGGALFILEDEPRSRPAAVRHYRDLQAFLARVDPGGRRPLLPRQRFEARLARSGERGGWRTGAGRNRYPADRRAAAALLRGTGTGTRDGGEGEAARLARAIARDGLDYGEYWWACWNGAEGTAG